VRMVVQVRARKAEQRSFFLGDEHQLVGSCSAESLLPKRSPVLENVTREVIVAECPRYAVRQLAGVQGGDPFEVGWSCVSEHVIQLPQLWNAEAATGPCAAGRRAGAFRPGRPTRVTRESMTGPWFHSQCCQFRRTVPVSRR